MEHTQQLELIDKLLLHLERGTTASADVIRGAEISVYSNGDLLALEKQKGVRRVLNFIGHAAFDEGGPAFGGASHFDASVWHAVFPDRPPPPIGLGTLIMPWSPTLTAFPWLPLTPD